MTAAVVYVRPEQSLEDCMALMTGKRIRHLPVLEGEQLIGVNRPLLVGRFRVHWPLPQMAGRRKRGIVEWSPDL